MDDVVVDTDVVSFGLKGDTRGWVATLELGPAGGAKGREPSR